MQSRRKLRSIFAPQLGLKARHLAWRHGAHHFGKVLQPPLRGWSRRAFDPALTLQFRDQAHALAVGQQIEHPPLLHQVRSVVAQQPLSGRIHVGDVAVQIKREHDWTGRVEKIFQGVAAVARGGLTLRRVVGEKAHGYRSGQSHRGHQQQPVVLGPGLKAGTNSARGHGQRKNRQRGPD